MFRATSISLDNKRRRKAKIVLAAIGNDPSVRLEFSLLASFPLIAWGAVWPSKDYDFPLGLLVFVRWARLRVDVPEIYFGNPLDFERFACSIHNLDQPIDRYWLDLCGSLCE